MNLKAIRYRLEFDFQLSIMTLLAAIALLGITPFTILRALDGQWLPFAVDLTIQIGVLACVLYAWQSEDSHRPRLVLAYFIGAMAVVAVFVLGAPGQFWFYPAIVANFFLVDRRHGLAIALLGLVALLLSGSVDNPAVEAASFYITVIVCALLGYAFAYRTTMQRVQLEAQASKDPLTNLYNRRTLIDVLEGVHRTFARQQNPCGLLVLDLDHFKQINDRYGHLAGDQVLIQVAQLLEQHVRKGDRLFRYGGEEFIVLAMPEDRAGLAIMAENLRRVIEKQLEDGHGQPVTTSIGGAILRRGESVQDWFARADTQLYVAKNSGRNRAIVDTDE